MPPNGDKRVDERMHLHVREAACLNVFWSRKHCLVLQHQWNRHQKREFSSQSAVDKLPRRSVPATNSRHQNVGIQHQQQYLFMISQVMSWFSPHASACQRAGTLRQGIVPGQKAAFGFWLLAFS